MSFAGTPLGQSRRLDHHRFLGKPPIDNGRPPSPQHLHITKSYSYGAPTLGSRSPSKVSPTRERKVADNNEDDPDLYLPLPSYNQSTELANRGAKIITSAPRPEKWNVRDTSVNVASAFFQAAADPMPPPNPHSQAWASSSSHQPVVPRSTSVEYEQQEQNLLNRRAALTNNVRPVSRKPLSKKGSLTHVPDSEGEEDPVQNGRGKTPLAQMYSTASYYVRQRSKEPDQNSYNYSAEEREFTQANRISAAHKKGRISVDNKAYKPSHSEEELSDEDFDDESRSRRKKKKKDSIGGPLRNLPVIQQDKRKKRKGKKNGKGTQDDQEEESESDDTQSQNANQRASAGIGPVTLRHSLPPDLSLDNDVSMDNSGRSILNSIEEEGMETPDEGESMQSQSGSHIAARTGRLIYFLARTFTGSVRVAVSLVSAVLFVLGRIFGTVIDTLLMRPIHWVKAGPGAQYIILSFIILPLVLFIYSNPHLLPSAPSRPTYQSPGTPAVDMTEFNARLMKIESLIQTLSTATDHTKAKVDLEAKNNNDAVSRLRTLESRVQKEVARALEAETQHKDISAKSIQAVRQEIAAIHARLESSEQNSENKDEKVAIGPDEEARTRLNELEERLGSVEGGLKEALELGKNAAKAGDTGVAWWTKLQSGKNALTIKSSDGQDVTGLITQMVDSAVSLINKDSIARPDFALNSGGAFIIPHLTSDTYGIEPTGLKWIASTFTGRGYAIGLPPVTAIHHDNHDGRCWPLRGTAGQLGVSLSRPVHITDITIEHVPKEVSVNPNRGSAPRDMEVWAMVEGKDNLQRLAELNSQRAARHAEALERGEEVNEIDTVPPLWISSNPPFIQIANFSYNIESSNHIQTFPVFEDIRESGIDFGIIVLKVNNNWGRAEYTCIYRLRVHGDQYDPTPSLEESS